jgi:hypothetical protein
MKYYTRITDPEKWGRVSFLKRTMSIKKVTHFGYVIMIVCLFFLGAYKVQEVSTLKVINQNFNKALDQSEKYMNDASETVNKKCNEK